jgi:hypothetical protein
MTPRQIDKLVTVYAITSVLRNEVDCSEEERMAVYAHLKSKFMEHDLGPVPDLDVPYVGTSSPIVLKAEAGNRARAFTGDTAGDGSITHGQAAASF